MSNRNTLRTILTQVAEQTVTVDDAITSILGAFPAVDDHARQHGFWNTTDEYGNIDGPYDTREEAERDGEGQYIHFVETDEFGEQI